MADVLAGQQPVLFAGQSAHHHLQLERVAFQKACGRGHAELQRSTLLSPSGFHCASPPWSVLAFTVRCLLGLSPTDEISTGLDSATAYSVVRTFRQSFFSTVWGMHAAFRTSDWRREECQLAMQGQSVHYTPCHHTLSPSLHPLNPAPPASTPSHPTRSVVHNLQRTFLISLLQPAPEIIDLFDDLLLLTDGRVIYQ